MHNLETAKIRQKYITYREMRERSNREGIPMEELKSEAEEPEPAKKTTKLKGKKPKK